MLSTKQEVLCFPFLLLVSGLHMQRKRDYLTGYMNFDHHTGIAD